MQVITFVKGVDDFGKEKVSNDIYKYNHHYPRVSNGDIILYFYPKQRELGIYQVLKETEFYRDNEGFQFVEGQMIRSGKSPLEFIQDVKKSDLKLGSKIESIIEELIKKYL